MKRKSETIGRRYLIYPLLYFTDQCEAVGKLLVLRKPTRLLERLTHFRRRSILLKSRNLRREWSKSRRFFLDILFIGFRFANHLSSSQNVWNWSSDGLREAGVALDDQDTVLAYRLHMKRWFFSFRFPFSKNYESSFSATLLIFATQWKVTCFAFSLGIELLTCSSNRICSEGVGDSNDLQRPQE